jgi:hypothetical protein
MTSAVKTTCKRKYGEDDYRTDWVDGVGSDSEDDPDRRLDLDSDSLHEFVGEKEAAAAALVPVRKKQGLDETTARKGKRTTEEEVKLENAVKKYNGEDWASIAALVPGRTKIQCTSRWHNNLHPKSDETTARKGRWTSDEDGTLADAVEKYNGEDWAAISELVPGRTNRQCWYRWLNELDPTSDETTARKGKWTLGEDSKLMDAVEKHNGVDWAAIAALVPGRTKTQCNSRWNNELDSKRDETTARAGEKWTAGEDSTLMDAVEKYNGADWAAIAVFVPGRTKIQCTNRWHNEFCYKGDETTARLGKWATYEDSTLTDAVEKHTGEDWAAISELVPGRKKQQCRDRWFKCLHPRRTTIRQKEHGTTNEAPALG